MPLTTEGRMLRLAGEIANILGKNRLHKLGFYIPSDSKVMALQAVMLNRVEHKFPSVSDIAKAGNIELQEIMENAVRSIEDLIAQLEGLPHDETTSLG